MRKTAQAIILRVDRRNAGKTVAFDRLYFFRQEEEMLLPRIFPWCLVIPYNQEFARVLADFLHVTSDISVRAYPHRRIPGKGDYTLRYDGRELLRTLEVDAYLAVVPMLYTTRARRTSVSSPAPRPSDSDAASPPVYAHPQYIMAPPRVRMRSRSKKKSQTFDFNGGAPHRRLMDRHQVNAPEAYLLQNGVRVGAPICQACENSLAYLQNDCFFGSILCYQHLVGMHPTAWQEGIRRLKALGEFTEPNEEEEKEEGDGDVV